MDSMGSADLGLGLYGAAQPLLQQAADSRQQLLGKDSLETAASLHSLGLLATRQGRLQDAQPLLERSLELREKLLDSSHIEVASSLAALVERRRARGAFDQALPLERRAEAIRRAAGGSAPATTGQPGATTEPVALARTLDLPPDVVEVLAPAPQAGLAVAASSNGISLLDLDARTAPVVTPLGSGEELLTVLGDGVAILRAGRRLLARVLFAGDRPLPDRVLVDDLDGDERIVVSNSGRRLVRAGLARLRVLDLESQAPRVLREVRRRPA
jgi:tetratricopeptide (TPR) repeat protein